MNSKSFVWMLFCSVDRSLFWGRISFPSINFLTEIIEFLDIERRIFCQSGILIEQESQIDSVALFW